LSNDVEKAADELHGLLRRAEDFDEVSAEGSRFVRENCSCERVVSELGKALEGVMYN
jgi:hypothetical protein